MAARRKIGRTASRIDKQGEILVENAIMDLLAWLPRWVGRYDDFIEARKALIVDKFSYMLQA